MKKLSLEQMKTINGGVSCGRIGAFFGVAGGILMIAALATNPVTLVGGLVLAHSLSFGIVGLGCGAAELAT
jgi:hypothetical protein